MKYKIKKEIDYMDIESLVSKLESKDLIYKKVMRRFQILFFIFIFFYAGLFLVNPDPDITTNDRIAGACYVIAFSLFTWQFRKNYKKFKTINYFDPVKKVLEDAEKRYRLWQKNIFIVGSAVFLIDVASLFVLYDRFIKRWSFWEFFTGVQLVYILAIGLGFTIGYIKWKVENKPIWLSAKKLLKELEE